MKPKLLVITTTFPRWQGDTIPPFVFELARRLTGSFEVHVLAPWSPGSQRREQWNDMHIHRYRYWLTRGRHLTDGAILPNLKTNKLLWFQVPFFVAAQLLAARSIARKEDIDIVHAHWIVTSGLVAAVLKRIFRESFTLVITTHGADVFGLGFIDFLKRWVLNCATRVTVVSRALRDEVLRMDIDLAKVEVLPMGVDLASFSPDRKDEQIKLDCHIDGPFLLFVGRLAEKKGVKYLIQAMPAILAQHPTAKLVIAGDGPLMSEMRDLGATLQVLDHVVFLGAVPNSLLPGYFATADIFIGPSVSAQDGDAEGFGLVFVEAMGCGTVPVSTDLPAIADIIVDGKTGFVVPQKDAKAISNVVIKILGEPEARQRIETEARSYVREHFDWGSIGRRYNELLKAALE